MEIKISLYTETFQHSKVHYSKSWITQMYIVRTFTIVSWITYVKTSSVIQKFFLLIRRKNFFHVTKNHWNIGYTTFTDWETWLGSDKWVSPVPVYLCGQMLMSNSWNWVGQYFAMSVPGSCSGTICHCVTGHLGLPLSLIHI